MSSFFSKKLDFPPNALILKDILSLFLMAEFQSDSANWSGLQQGEGKKRIKDRGWRVLEGIRGRQRL